MSRTRTAVLISGRGSNMTVLVEAAKAADYPAEIALVLSNRPEAAGLAYAAGQRIPTLALDHRAYPDRGSFDAALGVAEPFSRRIARNITFEGYRPQAG